MRLVVDTSVLVGELLRASGRARLNSEQLELFLPERMYDEVTHELPKRIAAFVRARGLSAALGRDLIALCTDAIDSHVVVLDESIYSALEDEALARTLRDPADWPVVACALAISADIWTNDNDFLGTGVATWTTTTLQTWLDRHP